MARKKSVHAYQASGTFATVGVLHAGEEDMQTSQVELCALCGYSQNSMLHRVPPAAPRPDPTPFEPGERIVVVMPHGREMGVIVELRDGVYGYPVAAEVQLDNGQRATVNLRMIRKPLQIPKFDTVEEADAWLEQQARQADS